MVTSRMVYENRKELLEEALNAVKDSGVDYCDIRIEDTDTLRITYRGNGLDSVSQMSGIGGCTRAAFKGGWGFASFNSLEDLHGKVLDAVQQAKDTSADRTYLAEVEPCVDTVPAYLVKDPASVSLKDKKLLMDHYCGIVLSTPRVKGVDAVYGDSRRRVFFANSEGARIEQEFVHVICRVQATARADGDVQQAGFSIGSLGDYGIVEGLDDDIKRSANRAAALLQAEAIKGGPRTVILDPILAGVFVHEAFGHLSESDNVAENDDLRKLMYMGRKFGGSHLNFTDGAAILGLRGSYKYDDEGTPAVVTPLVREGELVGRLHSRETAARLGERPTSNARAISAGFPPIVRMTNTVIEPGEATLDDLLEGVDEGVYVGNWYGGMTQHEMFTFSSGEAHMIRKGKIAEMIRPVMLTGNLFVTLENLDAIGNDLSMNQGGGCGKGGQMPLPVSNGSPHIRIRKCTISGA